MPKFRVEELEQVAVAILNRAGALDTEARAVGHHLIEANLAGHDSHGVLRLPQYVSALQTGKVTPGAQPKILKETECTATLDGQRGFGQITVPKAVSLAVAKAKASGVAAATICNIYHTGRVASYTLLAAHQGLVGLAVVNAGGGGQTVAPFGGLARRLATNPLSIAVPSGNSSPIVLDIATSVAAEGKIRECLQEGKRVPPGWIIDAHGRPSKTPQDFYDPPGGALLPLGGSAGYKGFGLAFMIDILAGALSGAGCGRATAPEPRDGFLFIALNIQHFIPLDVFYHHVQALKDYVKSCPVAPGFKEIYIPGEIELLEEQRRRAEGIEVPEATWNEIQAVAAKPGVDPAFSELFQNGVGSALSAAHSTVETS